MKILFVSTNGFAWGGSEELWSQAAVRLVEKGHKIAASVGYYKRMHPKIKRLIDKGIGVRFRKNKIKDLVCSGFDKLQLSTYRKFIRNSIEKHIYEEKPDVVVFSQATCFGAYPLMLYCKENKISYCSISQLNTEYGWPADYEVEKIAEAFHGARVTFFVSKGNLELFQLQIAEKLENASVVPNPFNLENIPELAWPNDKTINIAHVARLDFTHKGTDILLRCFAEPQWKERDFMLNIYGEGNQKLANKLADFCGTHNFRFRGYVANVADIWRKNHLLVLPSRYEGMPLSLIEAMYCGRPAVVTDVAGHSELIEDNVSGFIAEAATKQKFNQALEIAWERKDKWEEMGKVAKYQIGNLYTEDPVNIFIEKFLKAVRL